jgi:hypothetical protein
MNRVARNYDDASATVGLDGETCQNQNYMRGSAFADSIAGNSQD